MSSVPERPESAASAQRWNHPALASGQLRHVVISFLSALVIGIVAYVAIFQFLIPVTAPSAPSPTSSAKSTYPQPLPTPDFPLTESEARAALAKEAAQASYKRIGDRAASRADAIKLRVTARQARDQLAALTEEIIAWKVTYLPLLSDDMGRRIAKHEDHMNLAITALESSRPSDEEFQSWREQLDELIAPLDEVLEEKDNPAMVPLSHAGLIQDIARDLAKALASLRQDRLVLDALTKEVANLEPGPLTLREAQHAKRRTEAAARNKQIEDARQAALADAAKQLAEAEQEQIREKAQVELQKVKAKTAQERLQNLKLKTDEEGFNRAAAVELTQQRLKQEYIAARPQIQSLLNCFLQDGYTHRGKNQGKGPVSLNALQTAHALEQSNMGRAHLCDIVITNDRKGGGLPKAVNQSQSQNDTYNRAQELLLKFGSLMVADNLLAE